MDTVTGAVRDASLGYSGPQGRDVFELVADGDAGGSRTGRPWVFFYSSFDGERGIMSYDPSTDESYRLTLHGGITRIEIDDATGVFGGAMFEVRTGGTYGDEPYFWNGTHGAEPRLVADVSPGSSNSYPELFTELNSSHAIFVARGSNGVALWLWKLEDWGVVTEVQPAAQVSSLTNILRLTSTSPGTVLMLCETDEFGEEPCIARFPSADGTDAVAVARGVQEYPAGSPFE